MLVDEGDHHFCLRWSSAWAKYAEARRSIALAVLSSRFPHSSFLKRVRSSVVKPGRAPLSLSTCRTQRLIVSAVHPILDAIALYVAHCDSCSLRCSPTSRTARSRTSGKNLVSLLVTVSSQSFQSPAIRGRLTCFLSRLTLMNQYILGCPYPVVVGLN
jgi:hypothetical protein